MRHLMILVLLFAVQLDIVQGAPPQQPSDTLHQRAFGRFRGQRITAKNAKNLKLIDQHDDYVWKIVWSPDGKRVAFVHWEGPVEIRSSSDFQLLRKFESKRGPISFAHGHQPDTVAYCENAKVAHLHNLKTRRTIALDSGNSQPSVSFNPKGTIVATGGYGTHAKLWRASDGKLLKTLNTGRKKGGLTVVFDPDEEFVAVGNRNSTTTIFNAITGKKRLSLPKVMTQEIAFSPDGQTLACTYVDGSLGLWSVADGQKQAMKKTTARELYSVSWSRDGRLLATSGREGKITVWSSKDLSILRELDAPSWVISVRFSPDGTRLLASGGDRENKKVFLYGIPRR